MASDTNVQRDWKGSDRSGIPFGVRDGRLVAVADVERGLACGCACPGCGATLVAKRGKERRAHFAHHVSDEASGCYESAVHQYAKQVIAESRLLRLPAWNGHEDMPNPPTAWDREGRLRRGEPVERPAMNTEVRHGRVEAVAGEIRADASVTDSSGALLVEIRVSHPVDEAKAAKVRAVDARMIEIDLSECPMDPAVDVAGFTDWVRFAAPRHWIWDPEAVGVWERSRSELEARLSLDAKVTPQPSGMLTPASAEAWREIRRQFDQRELRPIGRPPSIDDPLIGCWVWLAGEGEAEIVERLTRAGGVYRVKLPSGSLRIIYLGRP